MSRINEIFHLSSTNTITFENSGACFERSYVLFLDLSDPFVKLTGLPNISNDKK